MPKVVINACYGGFSLSRAALHRLRKMGNEHAKKEVDFGEPYPNGHICDSKHGFLRYIPRDDPQLVAVVQEMGTAANGACAELSVVDVPDGVQWEIDEYDGSEQVAECHRTWR